MLCFGHACLFVVACFRNAGVGAGSKGEQVTSVTAVAVWVWVDVSKFVFMLGFQLNA